MGSPLGSQFPAQISIAFTLPFQLKLTLPFALFLQLSLLLLTQIGLAALKHLLKPVAHGIGPGIMAAAIRPKIMPRNAREALLDLDRKSTRLNSSHH